MGKDDVCLAYNGQNPGPPEVFEQSNPMEIMLVLNVEGGIQGLDVDKLPAEPLGMTQYSF